MTKTNLGKDEFYSSSKVEVAASNSFSSEPSLKENAEETKKSEKSVELQKLESSLKDEELIREEYVVQRGKSLANIKQKLQNSTRLKPSAYVGFSKLPYQVYRKGFSLTC